MVFNMPISADNNLSSTRQESQPEYEVGLVLISEDTCKKEVISSLDEFESISVEIAATEEDISDSKNVSDPVGPGLNLLRSNLYQKPWKDYWPIPEREHKANQRPTI